jgi:UDP-GlcNAc:undecaprenyl-phosphate GlcNAc-1-phosphate transferase
MPYSLSLALAACALTVSLTPVITALARRAGALDRPGPRRIHREPVPTLGGIAFLVATLGTAWIARVLPGPARELDMRPLTGLTLAALPLLALGLVDDLRGVGPWTKILFQIGAGLVLVHFGYGVPRLTNPFGPAIEVGVLSGPLAILWLLVVVNAINLIDGLDGLASGVVFIASATLWLVGRMHADFYVMFLAALLIGSTLGFLPWNFPPARVFMGDTGSHFLGLALAAASLLENRKETAALTLLLPLVALGVPLADSLRAALRRLGRGQHVFRGDTEHIHHRLLALGLRPRQVLAVLWGVCVVCGLIATLLAYLPRQLTLPATVALALILFTLFRMRRLWRGGRSASIPPEAAGSRSHPER